ncbi:MAG: DNA polymerase I [Clostridia bacterium]
MDKILLIDGNSILNRAFYGTQNSFLKNAEGLYTGALYGFMNIYLKQAEELQPEYAAVAFDVKAPTFRHERYAEYKAGRKGMPDELAAQFPVAKELLEAMGIAKIELPGFEADDILGTYSRIASENHLKCYIMTGDRDALQLIREDVRVLLCSTQKGRPQTDEYDIEAVRQKYGVLPEQLIDVKALMGDSSDNIPGVPGVGEKTAAALIAQYGSLDAVYAHIEEIKKPALKAKLEANKELAYLSRMLGEIERYAPAERQLADLRLGAVRTGDLDTLLDRLEFKSVKKKMETMGLLQNDAPAEEDGMPTLFSLMEEQAPQPDTVRRISAEELAASAEGIFYIYPNGQDDRYQYFDVSYGDDTVQYRCEGAVEPAVRAIFENKEIRKVLFNAKPFILYLLKQGISFENLYCDLSIAAYLLDSTRKSEHIEDVCRYLTGRQLPVNVHILKPMCEAAISRIAEKGMTELFEQIELPLVRVLAELECEGFRVDGAVLQEEGEEIDAKIESLTRDIYMLAGHEFNINSPKQLGAVLFEELGLKSGKKNKHGYSTNQDVLESISFEHPIIPLITEYRQNTKLKSTYIDGLTGVIDPATKRVYSCFNQTITATGRLSSTEPNLQNIPVRTELGKLIRKAFIPADENHILVDADYSQIELRVLAHMSGDEAMREAFRHDSDIHTITAAQVNGVPPELVTPQMRSRAKAVNFGIVYGISDFGLSRDLGIPIYEAKQYIESYFRQYPGVEKFMESLVAFAKENGYAQTLMGRRRYLPELHSAKYTIRQFGERVAMNMPIQGTAADIIKIAMIRVGEELRTGGYASRLILQVHDELLIDAVKSEQEAVMALLKRCMQDAYALDVPLKVDVTAGKSWYECK